jgi:hypothetical protein
MQLPHFEHVRAHLDRVQHGHTVVPEPDAVYLAREEEDHLWELVGLRLQGSPVVLLAALRFQRLPLPGISNARESLATYLTNLPAPRPGDQIGRIPAFLPHQGEQIPAFLRGMRSGRDPRPVGLDPARIDLAFDFRIQNPAAVKDLREAASPLREHFYRSAEGHVFRGLSHEVPTTGAPCRFVAVRSPEQLTPQGALKHPTLFVSQRFIALHVEVTEEATRLAARTWVPFQAAFASHQSLVPIP